MSSRAIRKSNITDDALRTLAGVVRSDFMKYKMFFTTFDPKRFTDDYEDRVLAELITRSQNIMSDEFFLTSQAKETADKDEATEELRRALKVLEYYVNARFGHNKAMLDEFLLSHVNKIFRNADILIGFTKDTLVKVETYKTELLEAGLTEELIANIETALDNLNRERREQVDTIRKRKLKTTERVDTINSLWKVLTHLQDAARILFYNNPEIRELFELPRKARKKKKTTKSTPEENVVA